MRIHYRISEMMQNLNNHLNSREVDGCVRIGGNVGYRAAVHAKQSEHSTMSVKRCNVQWTKRIRARSLWVCSSHKQHSGYCSVPHHGSQVKRCVQCRTYGIDMAASAQQLGGGARLTRTFRGVVQWSFALVIFAIGKGPVLQKYTRQG
jgi:hypothetical protein